MFDLAELYTEWTEDPQSFWGDTEIPPAQLQLQLSVEAESILNEEIWSQVLLAACPPPSESPTESREWLNIIISGLKIWSQCPADGTGDSQDNRREALEKYLFLTRMHLARLDKELDNIAPSATSRKSNATIVKAMGKVRSQLIDVLDAISRTLMGGLEVLFPPTASAKRASLALLYLEPSCRLLQRDIVVKDAELQLQIVRVLSLGVKLQHQQAMMRTQLLQLLTYYEHTWDVVVKLFETLRNQFDHTSLTEAVLRDLVEEAMTWRENASTSMVARAKCVSSFLQRLVQSMPTLVARNLPILTPLFWSSAPQLRQAAMDVSAVIIPTLLESNREDSSSSAAAVNADDSVTSVHDASESGGNRYKPASDLIEILEQRVNDVNHFCRLHALQTLSSVAGLRALASHRERFTQIACEKMKDRTQLVRRQAMRFMKELIMTHPNVIPTNQLKLSLWRKSLAEVEERLDGDEPEDVAQQLEAAQALCKLTITFIEQVDKSLSIAQTLLMSKAKSDILDAVELLVYADAYGVESSASGIRSIVHLVWAKADNDEANTVCKTAVLTYQDLFLTAPPELTPRQKNHFVAENLISLTKDATPGELTSLERLLCLAMEEDMIEVGTVGRLWGLYQSPNIHDPAKRRGAAIVLGMLALADQSIARSGIGALMIIGLNPEAGLHDLDLAKYSCVILKRSTQASDERLPSDYELFDQIIAFMLHTVPESNALQWCSFAKEALTAISTMCECPPKVYTRLIQEYTTKLFGDGSGDISERQRQALFAQLIYIVGEVALNLLVYLEQSEIAFKHRRQELADQQRTATGPDVDDEEKMMAGSGSVEDTFLDALHEVREVELMYSDRSLLKPFAGMIVEICKSELERSRNPENNGEPANLLVIGATQSLSKLMCVSSHFCSENLPLLVELMSQHESNVVRSNFVVALGDVAICFNRLIDDHTEFLYDRLNDPDQMVQRTCIVSLTFLILAGQIKVKGKLGEMAKAVAHPNRKISTLATMFFRELSAKENAIYNSFLDMLSSLIADETLVEKDMLGILKFLSELVEKERQMKQLTDKLLQRLLRCETQRQWNAIVQVLKSLPRKMDDSVRDIISRGFAPMPGQGSDESEDDDGYQSGGGDEDNEDEEEPTPNSKNNHLAEPRVQTNDMDNTEAHTEGDNEEVRNADPNSEPHNEKSTDRIRDGDRDGSNGEDESMNEDAADLSTAVGDMSLISV